MATVSPSRRVHQPRIVGLLYVPPLPLVPPTRSSPPPGAGAPAVLRPARHRRTRCPRWTGSRSRTCRPPRRSGTRSAPSWGTRAFSCHRRRRPKSRWRRFFTDLSSGTVEQDRPALPPSGRGSPRPRRRCCRAPGRRSPVQKPRNHLGEQQCHVEIDRRRPSDARVVAAHDVGHGIIQTPSRRSRPGWSEPRRPAVVRITSPAPRTRRPVGTRPARSHRRASANSMPMA